MAAALLLSPPPFRPFVSATSVSRRRRRPLARSYRGGGGGGSSSAAPETECPVPLEQQPVHEYQSLSTSLPFSWASSDPLRYLSRLAFTGASFALFVGLPIFAFGTRGPPAADPDAEALRCAIGAVSTGLLAVTLAVLRMYLGWAYVGNRLLSATVEYEETGWYDGQIWVKTPEVLARDRLLGSFSVKPALNRVKLTLIGLAISLVACALLYINVDSPKTTLLEDTGGRSVAGAYSDDSARSFEPDTFSADPSLSEN